MLTPDEADSNIFHTTAATVRLGLHAINTNNLPNLAVHNGSVALANVRVGSMDMKAGTVALNLGTNDVSINLTFTGGPTGAPKGEYDIYELVSVGGTDFAVFLKSREDGENVPFFLLLVRA